MKRALAIILVALSTFTARGDVLINLAGGNIYMSDGTTLAAPGSLLQLIVSRGDTIFTQPSPTSFIGDSSDDLVLASFGLNEGLGSAGTFAAGVNFTLSGTLGPGDQLLLRWFPTLTTAATEPGGGSQYGQYRTDAAIDGSDSGWFVPSDGSAISLNFLTMNQGGSNPETAGIANLTVVPEPSTYALLAAGLASFAFVRRRRQNAAK